MSLRARVVLGLILFLFFASTYPDGLEKVAESLGIEEPEALWRGLMPDYTIGFTDNPYLSTLISGLIGVFLVLTITWGVGLATHKRNNEKQ
jgi:cobalt/nickel transport protein